jgi:sugar phosphate isomerase/epimerase
MQLALEAGPATLDLARELAVAGVPLDADRLLRDGLAAALAPLRERGLTPCQVGAFFFNPLDPDLAARASASERVARLIPLAAEAGCPFIAFAAGSRATDIFGGAHPGNLRPDALAEAAATLEPLAKMAEHYGVCLSLEPHIRSVLSTPERSAALCSRVGSRALRVTLDVANFYDFFDLLDPDSMRRRCERELASCCGMIHFKEIALVPGFHLHAGLVPMGAGRTDWHAMLSSAAKIAPANGWLLVEHCSSADEARASLALVRHAAADLGLVLVNKRP